MDVPDEQVPDEHGDLEGAPAEPKSINHGDLESASAKAKSNSSQGHVIKWRLVTEVTQITKSAQLSYWLPVDKRKK